MKAIELENFLYCLRAHSIQDLKPHHKKKQIILKKLRKPLSKIYTTEQNMPKNGLSLIPFKDRIEDSVLVWENKSQRELVSRYISSSVCSWVCVSRKATNEAKIFDLLG